ncbi:MAG: alpha/beta hydrolase family protein [Gammaproteobacteria bacterium]
MKPRIVAAVLLAAGLGGCLSTSERTEPADPAPLSWRDLRRLPEPGDVPRLGYGTAPEQFGELRLPLGVPGPFPVMILIHGDCWGADEDYRYMRAFAEAVSTLGVATWTIEYRRPGAGGGWPDSFLDVAHAADHLRVLAQTHPLNLKRVVAAGHSGGGQLALWLAARKRLPASDPLHVRRPLPIHGVIGLAAMTDLEAQHAVTRRDCGSGVEALLGGPPAQLRDRYTQLSPIDLLPLRVPQWFVHGERDPVVSVDTVMHYAETARRKGDRVTLGVTSNAGHYEPVVPGSTTWMTVQRAVVAALLE